MDLDLTEANARLEGIARRIKGLGPLVTEFTVEAGTRDVKIVPGADATELDRLGIVVEGSTECHFVVSRDERQNYAGLKVSNSADGGLYLLGKTPAAGWQVWIRALGANSTVVLAEPREQRLVLPMIVLRSNDQLVFFGLGASCVGANIEVHGDGTTVAVGDDCMISSGVWMRNHDMHTMFDTDTGEALNAAQHDIILEQHVWVGQGALLLRSARIGYGSVLGAMSLLSGAIPDQVVASGTPARILKTRASWSRPVGQVLQSDRDRLARLDNIRMNSLRAMSL